MTKKLLLSKGLIIFSMLALSAFISWWLLGSFTDEKKRMERDLEVLLRETAVRLQMNRFMNDTTFRARFIYSGKVTPEKTGSFKEIIATSNKLKNDSNKNVEIIFDTIRGDRNNNSNWERTRRNEHTEVDTFNLKGIRINIGIPFGDLIQMDTLKKNYFKNLEEQNLPLPKEFKRTKAIASTTPPENKTKITEEKGQDSSKMVMARQTKGDRIEAYFDTPVLLLFEKISWQLIFSLAMLALTSAAFGFIYRTLKKQEELASTKNDLINNITHELKTPIATVGVALEALQNFNALQDPKRTKEYLTISKQELNRLSLLVDKVLNISMFDQNKITISSQSVDLLAICNSVIDSLKLQLEKADATVNIKSTLAQQTVIADEQHLTSVIFNLLDNAIKYKSEEPLKIDITFDRNQTKIYCSITDNGIGIQPEFYKKVFDRFFRVPNGDKHNVKGYGLGLNYVSEVLRNMKGDIKVESPASQGTTFTLWLPIA